MWTKEQQLVIDNRDSNLLVAAAAGSGKTAVMIERIIQRILDKNNPVDIDRLLVLTFTNAAANEMKERIRAALERELNKESDNENLQRQMTLLNMANICTIDSFCKNVLIKNIHATDLDYNVKIADPTEIDIVCYEVLEDLFEKLYEEENEEFVSLVDYYSSKNLDKDLIDIIFSLNKFINSSPYPEKWLDDSAEFFNIEDKNESFYILNYLYPISKDVKITLNYILIRCSRLLEEIFGYDDLEKYYLSVSKRLEYVERVIDKIQSFHGIVEKVRAGNLISSISIGDINQVQYVNQDDVSNAIQIWSDIRNIINSYSVETFGSFRVSKKMDPIAVNSYNSIKDEISDLRSEIGITFEDLLVDLDTIKKENKAIYPYLRSLSNICKIFRQEFSSKKKSMGIIDFSDLEHYVLEILIDEKDGSICPSKIAETYRESFVEVYTDEYQDSNMVQEIILSMVSKDDNRFMVGDVKQSIYRFRQAMPEIFMSKYHNYNLYNGNIEDISLSDDIYIDIEKENHIEFQCDIENDKLKKMEVLEKNKKNRKILLYKNFRSREEVLAGCNHVFSMIMKEDVGEIEYTKEEELNAGACFMKLEDATVCEGKGKNSHSLIISDGIEEDTSNNSNLIEESTKKEQFCGGAVEIHLLEYSNKNSVLDTDNDFEINSLEFESALKELNIAKESCNDTSIIDKKLSNLNQESDTDEELEGFRREGAYIANIIDDMVNNEEKSFMVFDKEINGYRKVQYKDIVVLMRSLKSKISDLEEIFSDYNIPIYSDFGDGYFDTLEVDTVINLLKVIDNPISDIELVAIMRSPIFDFTPKELSKIRMTNLNCTYYESILEFVKLGQSKLMCSSNENYTNSYDYNLLTKINNFIEKIDGYRKKSMEMKLSDFVWYILKDTGYLSYVSMLENGESRKNNLLLLFERARQYENTSYSGVFNFINYIERMKNKNTNLSEAKSIPDDFNMVRVMSIHKSKGLEFPVVIVANANKRFNFMPDHSKLSFHQEMGYAPKIFDKEKKVKYDSIYKKVITTKKEYESIAEEMRLLYVAMTRAKEKLIFTSVIKNFDKEYKKWLDTPMGEDLRLSSKAILNAKSYLNWIMPTIVRLNEMDEEFGCIGKKNKVYGYSKCKWQIFKENIDVVNDKYRKKLLDNEKYTEKKREEEKIDIINLLKLDPFENKMYFDGENRSIEELIEEDTKIKDILNNQLDYVYLYNNIASKPSRISVTDIKRIKKNNNKEKNNHGEEKNSKSEFIKDDGEENVLDVPMFIHGEEVKKDFSNAEKGTIFHLVLQFMDFSLFDSNEKEEEILSKLESVLDDMINRKIITRLESETVNRKWICRFIKNPLFLKIKDAQERNKLYKEKAINYAIDMNEIYPEIEYGMEKTMVVGIVDIFYEKEDGTYVLLDYKTDYVPDFNTEIIVERYKVQLEIYKKAMEDISGKKISEVYLYLFSIGKYVRIDL